MSDFTLGILIGVGGTLMVQAVLVTAAALVLRTWLRTGGPIYESISDVTHQGPSERGRVLPQGGSSTAPPRKRIRTMLD